MRYKMCDIYFSWLIYMCDILNEETNNVGAEHEWAVTLPAVMTPRGGSDIATMGLNCKVEDVDLCDKTWMWCEG